MSRGPSGMPFQPWEAEMRGRDRKSELILEVEELFNIENKRAAAKKRIYFFFCKKE